MVAAFPKKKILCKKNLESTGHHAPFVEHNRINIRMGWYTRKKDCSEAYEIQSVHSASKQGQE